MKREVRNGAELLSCIPGNCSGTTELSGGHSPESASLHTFYWFSTPSRVPVLRGGTWLFPHNTLTLV